MQADRQDRNADLHGGRDENGRHSRQTIMIAVGIIILVAGAYLLMPGEDEKPLAPQTALSDAPPQPELTARPVLPPKLEPDVLISEAPDIPEVEAEETAAPDESAIEPPTETATEPLPPATPEELDSVFREAIASAGITPADALQSALSAPYLLDRGISSADQIARGLVPRRTLNIGRPAGKFAIVREGTDYRVDPAGYERYDVLTSALAALPARSIAALFREYREELESAYASLGYPADAMDNTLIAALDQVLSAPQRETPPALVSKGAVWAYADPVLESASDLHKQLLRTGPDNTEALQNWARELRRALLQP